MRAALNSRQACGLIADAGECVALHITAPNSIPQPAVIGLADGAANLHRLSGDGEAAHARLTRGWRQERGEQLDGGALAGPVGAKHPEHLAGIGRQS